MRAHGMRNNQIKQDERKIFTGSTKPSALVKIFLTRLLTREFAIANLVYIMENSNNFV